MKRYRVSNKPVIAKSGNWTPYKSAVESNPNSVNTGQGRINKKRVMQLRYLKSIGIQPDSDSVLSYVTAKNIKKGLDN